jgi:hypothetical protein
VDGDPGTSVALSVARGALRVGLLVGFAWALHLGLDAARMALAGSEMSWAMPGLVGLTLVVYAALVAVPFMPGIEVGVGLLMALGPVVAPAVWAATTGGLSVSFAVGRVVPPRWLARTLGDLHLMRASAFVDSLAPLSPPERIALMTQRFPHGLGRWLVRYRYLALAVVLNLPGNFVLGGGGGILLLAGLSGLFRPWPTVATIALAVSPVPLILVMIGWHPFG